VSKEYIILKGVDTKFSGYATDTDLSGASGFKEYEGMFFQPTHSFVNEGDNITFSSSFKSTNRKHRKQILVRSFPISYPSSAIDYNDFFNDSSGNNFFDVISTKYLWIKNDHTLNDSDTRLHLVPTDEADYLTKNLAVSLISSSVVTEEGAGGFWYHIEAVLEYASR